MDFQIFGNETLKIKGKKASLILDPLEKISKIDAEAILLTGKDRRYDLTRVNDYRVVVDGPGEYEITGLKISGIKTEAGVIYELVSDGTNILVSRASSLQKISADKLDDYKIVVINTDVELNQSVITAMEPRVIVLYGKLKETEAKNIGSENIKSFSKINLNDDKLPEELEVMLLG